MIMIALYLRLSMADGDLGDNNKDESNSIENQRLLLRSYLDNNDDLQGEVIEYVDDGYTGTNFERPGFEKMLDDAKNGKIQVIIVKDFSRFGRDYIGVGDYLEQIFPILGIRFISLNNSYDSDDYLGKTMGLDMAVSNLVNNFYSRDLSVKRKSSIRTQWKQGNWTGAKPPFGYWKDKERKWQIDELASKSVRIIFDKALEGMSTRQISDYMNELGLPTPAQHCFTQYGRKYSNTKASDNEQLWDSIKIRTILGRREYTGAIVMGKRQSVVIGGKITKKSAKHELYITENHHPAIVSKEEYEIAQDSIRFMSKPEFRYKKNYSLKGKIRCGNCRLGLVRNESGAEDYYYCYHKNTAGKYSQCSEETYPASVVEATVLYSLKCIYKTVKKIDMEMEDTKHRKKAGGNQQKILSKQMEQFRAERIKQYELYADGTISREAYVNKKEQLTEKIDRLQEQLFNMEKNVTDNDEIQEFFHGTWTRMDALMTGNKLTKELVDVFINNVYVYDLKHIEVEFSFEDVYKEMMERYQLKKEA